MIPFPLLKLPLLAAKEVVFSWNDRTVIILGLVSRRTKRLIGSCKYPLESMGWIIKGRSVYLKICSKTSYFVIQFGKNDEVFHWTLDGISAKVSFHDRVWIVAVNFPVRNKTLIDAAEFFTHQLLKICNPKSKTVSNYEREDHSENSFVWKLFPKFDVVSVGDMINPNPISISAQRLKFYFEEVKTNKLYLSAKVASPTFKYSYAGPAQQKSNFEKLGISRRSDWVDFSNFFNSFNSPNIHCTTPSSESVNEALKEWIGRNPEGPVESGFDHELVHFETNRVDRPFKLDELLKDTNATVCDLTEKQRKQFAHGNSVRAFEIKREFDDRKATLMFHGDSLKMVIWTQAMIKKHEDFREDEE